MMGNTVHQTSSGVSIAVPQENHINKAYAKCTIHSHVEMKGIKYRRAGNAVTHSLPSLLIFCATL
jgi:hypothetical protein